MKRKKSNQGVALISILAITAIALIVISAAVIVSIVNIQMALNQLQTRKAHQTAEGLTEEVILKFIRFRNFTNPYSEWTENCLQIENIQCKMDYSLDQSGGTINSWGKSGNKLRQLQTELIVSQDESVSVSARREIY